MAVGSDGVYIFNNSNTYDDLYKINKSNGNLIWTYTGAPTADYRNKLLVVE